jgi:hypothetical protein
MDKAIVAPTRDVESLTPVLFRVEQTSQSIAGGVTAVFMCEPYSLDGLQMSCYAHVGQHGACTWQWVRERTRAATPDEYAALKAELESIGYKLRVFKYRTRPHKIAFGAALDRLRKR